MAFQGTGKIRLLARNGLFRDDAATARYLDLAKRIRGVEAQTGGMTDDQAATHYNDIEQVKSSVLTDSDEAKAAKSNYYIEFDATPEITESGSAMYAEASDIRAPSSILWYQGSPSRTFSISAKLIARTVSEASRVADQIHVLKSWRMPETEVGGVALMTPPTLLYLQGYGNMFKDIPVVMTDLSFDLPSEHDYIRASNGNDVPIITQVSITLREAHAVDLDGIANLGSGFKQFNILDYRLGRLKGW